MSLQNKTKYSVFIFILTITLLSTNDLFAQRMGHAASRGGGGRGGQSMSRTAPNKSASSRQTASPSRTNTRNKATSSRQSSTPSTGRNKSINGGHTKSTDRKNVASNRNDGASKVTNKNTNNSKTRNNSGNKVNVDKSRNNINVNVDNSKNFKVNNQHNTRVRSSSVRYSRPPYRYGGFGYYCHRPYFYHPYRPFYWGPAWHPWGWFAATLATTAIIVSINNQKYHYDQGTYYVESDGGYTVVQAPVGATVKTIPKEAEVVEVNETTNNYYYGGAYYEKSDEGYTVVPATAGTIVPNLPEGGEEVKIGEVTYVQFGDTYYQPVQVDGNDMYEIVEVKEE
jgi:hypothetical protein